MKIKTVKKWLLTRDSYRKHIKYQKNVLEMERVRYFDMLQGLKVGNIYSSNLKTSQIEHFTPKVMNNLNFLSNSEFNVQVLHVVNQVESKHHEINLRCNKINQLLKRISLQIERAEGWLRDKKINEDRRRARQLLYSQLEHKAAINTLKETNKLIK